jgi:ATP-binding cassette subfamily F protein 3
VRFSINLPFEVPLQIVGDDTLALDSVLKADVWRDRLLAEEKQLNVQLAQYESTENPSKADEEAKEEAETRLAEVHANLADIEAESGPARASQLLSGE